MDDRISTAYGGIFNSTYAKRNSLNSSCTRGVLLLSVQVELRSTMHFQCRCRSNRSQRPSCAAGFALHHDNPSFLVHRGVGLAAFMAHHEFLCILGDFLVYRIRIEFSLKQQLAASCAAWHGQFLEQEFCKMLWLTPQRFSDIREIPDNALPAQLHVSRRDFKPAAL